MKPQQILNKLAKYNKKVELSAEPMKVELGELQDLESNYNRLMSELKEHRSMISKLFAKFASEEDKVVRTLQESDKLIIRAKQARDKAKELGVESAFSGISVRDLENERSMTEMAYKKMKR